MYATENISVRTVCIIDHSIIQGAKDEQGKKYCTKQINIFFGAFKENVRKEIIVGNRFRGELVRSKRQQ